MKEALTVGTVYFVNNTTTALCKVLRTDEDPFDDGSPPQASNCMYFWETIAPLKVLLKY